MIHKLKIGKLNLKNNLFLAPMSGVTNIAFRSLCRKYGASLCFTEFVNSHSVLNKYNLEKLKSDNSDKPLAIQIFGNDVDSLVSAAKKIESQADIIDINLGCPAYKVIRCGAGSELLKDLNKIKLIVSSIVDSVSKPVSVKIRSGIDDKHINAVEVAEVCELSGAKMITIHARTQKQGYSGKVNLDVIKNVKKAVSIPVIANGDIVDRKSALHTFELTECDGLMIGRAAMKNPSIFSAVLGNDIKITKIQLLKDYYSLLKKYDLDFTSLKETSLNLMHGINGAVVLRRKISSIKTFEEFDRFLEEN